MGTRRFLITVQVFTFFFLSLGEARAAYECANPPDDFQRTQRCMYVKESIATYDQWKTKHDKVLREGPEPGNYTVEKILSIMGPIAASCANAGTLTDPRLNKCASEERNKTKCLAPSRTILKVSTMHTAMVRQCAQLQNNDAMAQCYAKRRKAFSDQHFDKLLAAGYRLGRSTDKRYNNLLKEERAICKNQCLNAVGANNKKQCIYRGSQCNHCTAGTTPLYYELDFATDVDYINPLYSSTTKKKAIKAGKYRIGQINTTYASKAEQERYRCQFIESDDNGAIMSVTFNTSNTNYGPTLAVMFPDGIFGYWKSSLQGQLDCRQTFELTFQPDSRIVSAPTTVTLSIK